MKDILNQVFVTTADPKKVDEFASRPQPKPICNTVNKAKLIVWLDLNARSESDLYKEIMNKIKSGEWDV